MARKTQRDRNRSQMMEYLLPRLNHGDASYECFQKEREKVGIVDYLKDQAHNKIVFMIDRPYTQKEFDQLLFLTKNAGYAGFVMVFYKDGKHYFRNAAQGIEGELQGVRFKQQQGLTLKHYDSTDVNRMIHLSRPEIAVQDWSSRVHYYQPASDRLDEMIVSYQFEPVIYDRTHIPWQSRLCSTSEQSKKIFIWNPDGKTEYGQGLLMKNNRFEAITQP
jgi:hypothetical protein